MIKLTAAKAENESRSMTKTGNTIVFLAPTISRQGGGLADPVRRTAQVLAANGHWSIQVISVEDRFSREDVARWQPLQLDLLRPWPPRSFAYSPKWRRRLNQAAGDVLHVHGLWTYLSVIGSSWARQHGKPYVVSVHGMLNEHALRRSAWKKRLFAGLFQRGILRRASCLHALTSFEADAIRAYGIMSPICVIPNGVDLPEAAVMPAKLPPWSDRNPEGRAVLLYLSRLHPIKGVVELIVGWHQLKRRRPELTGRWLLALAGFDEFNHRYELEQLVKKFQLQEDILFHGPIFGMAKQAALTSASAYVLPSLSEGMPIAILEAWSHGLAVLCTTTCHLPEGAVHGAAIEVEPKPGPLSEGLEKLMMLTQQEREAMGQRGRRLVEQRFLWKHVAERWDSVYRWIMGRGDRPECVQL